MAKSGKSYLTRFDEAFNTIGSTNGTMPPKYNDKQARVSAEFAMAARLRTMAEKRHAMAKDALIEEFKDFTATLNAGDGKKGAFGNKYCGVSMYKRAGQSRLDKQAVINKLCTEHGFKLEKAQALIEACTKRDNDALMIEATIYDMVDDK